MADTHSIDATQVCKRCNNALPATEEHFYVGSRGRLFSKCKPCVSEETKLRKALKDPDRHQERQAEKAEKDRLESQGLRKCSRCGEIKPATEKNFTVNASLSSGITSLCRECARKATSRTALHLSQHFLPDLRRSSAARRTASALPVFLALL